MATVATYLRRTDLAAVDSESKQETADPYRLRGLPGDNLYLFSKRIDNSRLIRQANPKTRNECWSAIATATVLAVVIGTAVSPRVSSVLTGYRTEKLRTENRALQEKRRMLAIEEARMLTPNRLDEIAAKRRLMNPTSGQEQHLQGRDNGLALTVASSHGTNP